MPITEEFVMSFRKTFPLLLLFAIVLLPATGLCGTVENSIDNVEGKIRSLLPVLSTIGLGWAGVSFLIGSPNARNHLILAIIGAAIGFGASSLMSFIRGIVS